MPEVNWYGKNIFERGEERIIAAEVEDTRAREDQEDIYPRYVKRDPRFDH